MEGPYNIETTNAETLMACRDEGRPIIYQDVRESDVEGLCERLLELPDVTHVLVRTQTIEKWTRRTQGRNQ